MRIILFDTSVLVAGFVASHSKHHQSLAWLKRAIAKEFTLAVSTHSLAECYAVLTRLPLSPKISPSIAKVLIEENIVKIGKIVSLTSSDYLNIIKEITGLGLTGGVIYDAVTFKAAKKIKAHTILTLNLRDFQRFSPENHKYIISP